MTYNHQLFVERLKSLRKEKDFSQEQLAKAVNVSRAAVGHWELGIRTPDLNTVSLLSAIFECSLSYILGLSTVRDKDILSSPVIDMMYNADVPMFIMYCDGSQARVRWINNSALIQFGYSQEEFLNLSPEEFCEQLCLENLEGKKLLLQKEKSLESGWIYIGKDGRKLMANQTINKVTTTFQTYYLITINYLSSF